MSVVRNRWMQVILIIASFTVFVACGSTSSIPQPPPSSDPLERELTLQNFERNGEITYDAPDKARIRVYLYDMTFVVQARRSETGQWKIGCLDAKGTFIALTEDRDLAEIFYNMPGCPPAYVAESEGSQA